MAGYNPTKMTAKTFTDRRANAKQKMSADGFKKFDIALTAAEKNFLNAEDESDEIYDFKKKEKQLNKKNNVINRFLTKRKQKKEDARVAKEEADAATTAAAAGTPSFSYTSGQRDDGGGNFSGAGSNVNSYTGDIQGGGNIVDEFAKGGRVGYFFGGRVNFKDGGLASIL